MTDSRGLLLKKHPRRGMLLLLVLSMLTLFALMGTLAMVIATRSRESARAFAMANTIGDGRTVIAKAMADEALLLLIRGSKEPAVNDDLLRKDNLLKDKYLDPINAEAAEKEDYDAYDDNNPFLTHLLLDADGRIEEVHRPAFGDPHAECKVDNDGDGILDGVWLPQSLATGSTQPLPPLTLADGSTLQFRVSYLVLDLDGRINVNAHGKPAGDQSTASGGPADLNGSPVLPSAVWNLLLTGTGGQLLTGSVSPNDQWRKPPPVNSPVDGRFGAFTGEQNQKNELEYTYAVRLDLEALRPGVLANAAGQNPFTLGELERVLRQFDNDASTLPPRLAAILHDRAERSRFRVTTDSWDTPGDRYDIKWEADNSGVTDEKAAWAELWPKVKAVDAGISEAAAKQWVANVLDFRDTDNAETNFDGGIKGVEPGKLTPPLSGPWNDGLFRSFAQLLAVPAGTEADLKQKQENGEPLISLAKQYPKILDTVTVPFFLSTLAQNPNREPGRINVNTCDNEVWKSLLGVTNKPNPFAIEDHEDEDESPAKHISDVLLSVPLVFADELYDATTIDHAIANRLANVATVRSHVFAVWLTLEMTNSAQPDQPSYHRLFAVVDRSIPVTFTAGSQGTTTDEIRKTIRLQRFLN